MTALERDLLGNLGYWKDTRTTYTAADLAGHLGFTVPRVQGGLAKLRAQGLVRYFDGHPGKWSITPAGRQEIAT